MNAANAGRVPRASQAVITLLEGIAALPPTSAAMVTLFDRFVPGAVEALFTYATQHALEVTTKTLGPSDAPFVVATLRLGTAYINVQCEVQS